MPNDAPVRRRRRRHASAVAFVIAGAVTAAATIGFVAVPTASAQRLTPVRVAGGFDRPTWVGHAPDDHDRLFVIERASGLIRIARDGEILPTPFLNIHPMLRAQGDGGFMSMAFHPDYADNGLFFIYFTNRNGDAVVARHQVSPDPDIADPTSATEIIKILRNPDDNLHAGGFIGFGPTDGYLYISTGDGGPQGDPEGHAQDRQLLLGKILRIDVDNGTPYTIPADNPFVDDPETRDEIWALGFRNPWRMSIDRETGDLYIGDVGLVGREEVSVIPNGEGGGNYGWAIKEGTLCFNPPQGCDPTGALIDPVVDYRHRFTDPPIRCAVIGGAVYRGEAMPLLRGTYFFSDYCSNEIFTFRYENGEAVEQGDRTSEVRLPGGPPDHRIVSFGENARGELYIVDHGGEIYRVESAMKLEATDFIAGQQAMLTATGVTPGERAVFAYSRTGTGRYEVPPMHVTVALNRPVFLGADYADGSGAASRTVRIPRQARGRRIWAQAIEDGNSSNVLTIDIQ